MDHQDCHLVLIEDNPADVYLVQEALRSKGINCRWTVFTTYEGASECLAQDTLTSVDAMLIDVNLRTGSGLDILRTVRESAGFRTTRAAILTSSDSPRDKESALALGADLYIRKPAGLDEFFDVISSAVLTLLGRKSASAAHPE